MLNGSEPFSTDGQKYTFADRAQMDRLLYLGAQSHHHNGISAPSDNPTLPGTLVAATSGGTIPPATTSWYEYTFVDVTGAETLPSPPVSVTLADTGGPPANPTIAPVAGAGTLSAGDYFYSISAYTSVTTNESRVSASAAYCFLPALGEIIITFPALPVGATGFNIYRKASNELSFMFLASTTSTTTYTDDGSVVCSCTRSLPSASSVNGTNSIAFTLPVAIPDGFTWNLYRTTLLGQWTGSLLANVVEGVSTYTDTGAGNLGLSPPLSSQLVGSPTQIDLTSEVTGLLPLANVAPVPHVVTFIFPGPLTTQTGKTVWVNDYDSVQVVSVRASLGRGSAPAVTPVIVNVNASSTGATPTYTSIFPGGLLPQVAVGVQIGVPQAPPSTVTLATGVSLSVDITQVGGGATPTDHDLTVNILVLAS